MTEDSSSIALEPTKVLNPVHAQQIVGRARVKFERHNDASFIVFVDEFEKPALIPEPNATDTNENTTNIKENTTKLPTDVQLYGESSDSESIWSADLPKKHSSKIAGNFGWFCVGWLVVAHSVNITANVYQNGSAAWAIVHVVSGVLSNEVPFFVIPFLICVCPSVWQAIWFLVVWGIALLTELILVYTLPWWSKTLYFANFIIIAIIVISLFFVRRIHLHFKFYHKKGHLLQMTVSLLRYYALISIAELIQRISNFKLAEANGEQITLSSVSASTYSALFSDLSGLMILLIHVQYHRYPQARSTFDLFGIMKLRDFFPFALIIVQLIIFIVEYVSTFSNIDLSSTFTTSMTIIFYLCFAIIVVQLIAIVTKTRWLAWLI